MWLVLAAIAILALLSVLGAFYGAERAKSLFNSVALQFYFSGFFILLTIGFLTFRSLLHKPGLFMVHAGCLLTLAGAMWGSESGHRLAFKLLGSYKIPEGYIVIEEGLAENRLFAKNFTEPLAELPFSIKLKDFRLEYYQLDKLSTPLLNIETADEQHLQLPAEAGEMISLGEGKGKITVVRTFGNFKIRNINDERIVIDEEGTGVNPAVQVEIQRPDGSNYTRYVFERFPDFSTGRLTAEQDDDTLQLSFVSQEPPVIRDFLSEVAVIKDDKEILSKVIEVNHPLHYGGYHFYQHSYDAEEGKYTILSVTSDSGLYCVYAGYWLLCLGVIWHFWLRHIVNRLKLKTEK
jgi:hypothetical protein